MEELPEDVVESIDAGNTVQAIKRLRAATGMSLAEAKSVVELYGAPTMAEEPSPAVMSALAAGRTIEAIKLYRQESGVGLREAKIRIEALQGKSAPAVPFKTTGGLRSLIKMLVIIAVVVAVYVALASA